MEIAQLKFLLKLAGRSGYCGKINELKPSDKTKEEEVESICRQLLDRDLVACSEEIRTIKLSAGGKALLKKSDAAKLEVKAEELKILKACQRGAIAPSKIKFNPAKKRQELIDDLIQQASIEAATTKIQQVWLTERGKEYLAKEYDPKGARPILSLNLLNNYLRFLREYFSLSQSQIAKDEKVIKEGKTSAPLPQPSDEEILQAIVDLDRELGTENYLPIFYLRNRFQPPLCRDELDLALYRLQRQDKIELSSLVETVHYTKEQIEAGISQDVGGPLFFLMVN